MASETETTGSGRRYPVWARAFALLVAFGLGGGVGAGIVVGVMVAASKGLIPWVN